jgi:hypothetical protein
LPGVWNSEVRSIQTVTDAKPSDENDRKEEFVAKKPSFNNSFQSKKLNRRPCHEAENVSLASATGLDMNRSWFIVLMMITTLDTLA